MIPTLELITPFQLSLLGWIALAIAVIKLFQFLTKKDKKIQHNFPPPAGTELGDKPTWASENLTEQDILIEDEGSMRVIHMCKDDDFWYGR